MMDTALEITVLGMGGVFFFLYLLTEIMRLLYLCLPQEPEHETDPVRSVKTSPEKIALAVALAHRQRK